MPPDREPLDEIVWPPPRDDPPVEPSHRAARIVDRQHGRLLGDVLDEDEERERDADA